MFLRILRSKQILFWVRVSEKLGVECEEVGFRLVLDQWDIEVVVDCGVGAIERIVEDTA